MWEIEDSNKLIRVSEGENRKNKQEINNTKNIMSCGFLEFMKVSINIHIVVKLQNSKEKEILKLGREMITYLQKNMIWQIINNNNNNK